MSDAGRMTTARVIGSYYSELIDLGIDFDTANAMARDAAQEIISSGIVVKSDD